MDTIDRINGKLKKKRIILKYLGIQSDHLNSKQALSRKVFKFLKILFYVVCIYHKQHF